MGTGLDSNCAIVLVREMKSGIIKMSMLDKSSCGTAASLEMKLSVKSLVRWREKYILVERPTRRRLGVGLDIV